jgi:acyl-Coa thioesterase superfamily protein/acyl-CoA thioesterase superfamily protein
VADDAFFVPDGDAYLATELTRGPWDPDAQHAGPPAALLAREVERVAGSGRRIGRLTYEILRAVPIGRLRVEAEIVRGGRRVELIEARLSDESGPVVAARAWGLAADELSLDGELDWEREGSGAVLRREVAPPGPGSASAFDVDFFPTGEPVGYHTAMEYRFVAGEFVRPGPATAWLRMRCPLIAGEEPTPLQRVAIAADSGNGISAPLDFRRFLFINVDLTIHLGRPPGGEWICLESTTIPDPSGLGITDTALYDECGPVGRAAQTLLVRAREPERELS